MAKIVFPVILFVYIIFGILYAIETPAWQAPDEPAHYNYVQFVAKNAKLPELCPGDYPAAYLEEIKARGFPPSMPIDSLRYESHQPPLYYIVAAIVYRFSHVLVNPPMPLTLRLFSLALGALSLVVNYRLTQAAFPSHPLLALGTTAFAALLPMHVAMTATVNNDVLAELILNLLVWGLVSIWRKGWTTQEGLKIGALLGLAFLTKMQTYIAFGLVALTLIWDAWQAEGKHTLPLKRASRHAGVVYGVALLMGLPWLIRNVTLYGLADPLGMVRHDQVVVGQLTTAQYLAQKGPCDLLRAFVITTFRSFWGQFGWMGVVLHPRVYGALALLSGAVVVGLGHLVFSCRSSTHRLSPHVRRSTFLFVSWAALTTLSYVWYNTKYVQHQGRYLFPALAPWGIAFTMGLYQVLHRASRLTHILLGAGIVVLLVHGALVGDVKGFDLALLVAALTATFAGRWIEKQQAGSAFALLYGALAILNAVCIYGYIVPLL
ncbi:MAG: phospholipid carrier-dependent glycosyltransferase [Chloroflexota bacterium]|nr:phospholipid carrier-dependent glycosyltransferase [Chloroflexota bacterium]